jgi:hypothetical protein
VLIIASRFISEFPKRGEPGYNATVVHFTTEDLERDEAGYYNWNLAPETELAAITFQGSLASKKREMNTRYERVGATLATLQAMLRGAYTPETLGQLISDSVKNDFTFEFMFWAEVSRSVKLPMSLESALKILEPRKVVASGLKGYFVGGSTLLPYPSQAKTDMGKLRDELILRFAALVLSKPLDARNYLEQISGVRAASETIDRMMFQKLVDLDEKHAAQTKRILLSVVATNTSDIPLTIDYDGKIDVTDSQGTTAFSLPASVRQVDKDSNQPIAPSDEDIFGAIVVGPKQFTLLRVTSVGELGKNLSIIRNLSERGDLHLQATINVFNGPDASSAQITAKRKSSDASP